MGAVQIPFVKMLQKKLQETHLTILKYKNEMIFKFCFDVPAVFENRH